MVTNKWIQLAMSLIMALVGWGLAFDWSSLLDVKTGGSIIGILAIIKGILNVLAPSPGAAVVPTGGAVVTHQTVSQ